MNPADNSVRQDSNSSAEVPCRRKTIHFETAQKKCGQLVPHYDLIGVSIRLI